MGRDNEVVTDGARRDVAGIAAGIAVAVLCVLGSVNLFAWDADGAFAVNDGLWYAKHAEEEPWTRVSGHHPLFHVVLNATTAALASFDVPHPGHVGGRILGGLAAGVIVLTLGAMAGHGRFGIGVLCALPLLATRGFVIEAGTGENVLPACAAALLALWLASREQTPPSRAGLALLIALGLRQDNILLVPAFMVALDARPALDREAPGPLKTLAATGIATIALYLGCWWVGAGDVALTDWVFDLATNEGRAWAPDHGPLMDHVLPHLSASGLAVTGLQFAPSRPAATIEHAAIGVGFMALLLVGGSLLRGDRRGRPFLLASTIAIACRFPFFVWFEPLNFEWWLATLTLIAGMAATLVAGAPVTSSRSKRAGVLVLFSIAILVGIAHGPGTAKLRDRRLARSRDAAISLGGEPARCRYLVYGARAHAAFHVVDLPHETDVLTSPDGATVQVQLAEALARRPIRTVILLDRWIGDGMPWTLRERRDALAPLLDSLEDTPTSRYLREDGRVVVIGVHLDK